MYHHPPSAVYAQSPSAASPAQWGQSPWAQPALCGSPQGGYAANGPPQRLGPHAAAMPPYWVSQSWGAPPAVNAAVGFGPPQPSPHVLASAVGAAAAASSAAAASAASACFSSCAPCVAEGYVRSLKRPA